MPLEVLEEFVVREQLVDFVDGHTGDALELFGEALLDVFIEVDQIHELLVKFSLVLEDIVLLLDLVEKELHRLEFGHQIDHDVLYLKILNLRQIVPRRSQHFYIAALTQQLV